MPDRFGVPVVTAACFFCCRRAMGAVSIRHSLCPLFFMRDINDAELGHFTSREREGMSQHSPSSFRGDAKRRARNPYPPPPPRLRPAAFAEEIKMRACSSLIARMAQGPNAPVMDSGPAPFGASRNDNGRKRSLHRLTRIRHRCREAAIDGKRLAVDVRSLVAREKQSHSRDL